MEVRGFAGQKAFSVTNQFVRHHSSPARTEDAALEGMSPLRRYSLKLPDSLCEADNDFPEADLMTPVFFCENRHRNNAQPEDEEEAGGDMLIGSWRMRERMKTVSVALVLCLNIGVDPPDVVKTSPCARLECWVDPRNMAPSKALEQIGKNMQLQYERWQPRARYKQCLDPTRDEIKKLVSSLRRSAKDERVLFHFNGHGVPRPTQNGEIWVFNKNYTQYIPLPIYDLQTWIGSPSIFVFDCSGAGSIVMQFCKFAAQRQEQYERGMSSGMSDSAGGASGASTPGKQEMPLRDCILLAACGANEILPMNPDLPADVFTACLTTPIEIALRWFFSRKLNRLVPDLKIELLDKIPGKLNDRRTPLGELNWIFTAITDTIAWNVLPRDVFQKLFRQDLLVASLFRNFLLAERIMRSCNCTPISQPKLPPTYQHSMWQAWDYAVDICLTRLPDMVQGKVDFEFNPFFTEQLTAFEVWLSMGNEERDPPEQLPIVLQVLLSQTHRLRALQLLGDFLDLGPWAVGLALSVGIFPYVLKLLQSPSLELCPVLVFIWAKILAVDKTCQADLLKDNGHKYFVKILNGAVPTDDTHKMQAAFVLSVICDGHNAGQIACMNAGVIDMCLEKLISGNASPLLRQWLCLCLGKVWENFDRAKWCAVRDNAQEKICNFLTDPVPEVRAAAVYALGTFIGNTERGEHTVSIENNIGITLLVTTADSSPMVRKELAVALSGLVEQFESKFRVAAMELMDEDRLKCEMEMRNAHDPYGNRRAMGPSAPAQGLPTNHSSSPSGSVLPPPSPGFPMHSSVGVYSCMWKIILNLSADPFPEVAKLARSIVNSLHVINRTPGSSPTIGDPTKIVLESSITRSSSSKSLNKSTGVMQRSSSLRSLSRFGSSVDQGEGSHSRPSQAHGREGARANEGTHSSGRPGMKNYLDSSAYERFPEFTSLKSTFYEYSLAYFRKPTPHCLTVSSAGQQQGPPGPGPTSATPPTPSPLIGVKGALGDPADPEYIQRSYRTKRNHRTRCKARLMQQVAKHKQLDDQVAILDNETDMASLMAFAPFEPYLVVSDERDNITVWNWEKGERTGVYKNQNPYGSRITTLKFLNKNDIPLLLAGSDEGVVRVWRNYETADTTLVTAWRALSDLLPSSRGSGLVVDWEQDTGNLLTSGDVRFIRIWNVEKELCVQDIPTGADSCVTAISCDKIGGSLVCCGCGDGSVRMYDKRMSTMRKGPVLTMQEHGGWVVNLHLQKGGCRELISASVTGEIKFWDPRFTSSVKTIQSNTDNLTALAVHDYAPAIACGSHNQYISNYNLDGDLLGTIRYHDGFLGQRIGPISCLAFHPYKVLLAAGSTDSIVSIYSISKL
eukprot:Nk52_evm6s327 gene=Nk52_evmTU6s327